MKALLFREYGGPDTMELADVPAPEIGSDEVRVDIHAASLNPIDWKIRAGLLRAMFEAELPRIPGRDFSGVIAEVGNDVVEFSVGDEVFGSGSPLRNGSHAEQIAVAPGAIAPKPRTLDHVEAASIVVSGLTAIAALEETAPVKKGDRVLIHAGAGGVGSVALQLAKNAGAHVITTASASNHDRVRALGADQTIDYRTTKFEDAAQDCDIVFDTVGGDVHVRSLRCLRPGGTLVYINASPIPDAPVREDVSVVNAPVKGGRAALERLAELADGGIVRPTIEQVFPLDEAKDAYELLETGHARGKIVLRIA